MVIPFCTLSAVGRVLTYDKMIIFRDIGMYVIAICAILIYAIDGKFTVWKSAVLLGLYCLVIVATIIMDFVNKKDKGKKDKQEGEPRSEINVEDSVPLNPEPEQEKSSNVAKLQQFFDANPDSMSETISDNSRNAHMDQPTRK